MTRSLLGWMSVLALGLGLFAPSDARACGGCFHPPEGSPSPVNGHRMAIAVSPSGTTLWDQIQYEGSPEDFVWVLPVMGTPMVEQADNGFFEVLVAATQIVMRAPAAPRTFCTDACDQYSFGIGAAGASYSPRSEDGGPPPVTVHYEGVVGPYETATIGSADPAALVSWLRDHGYAVPDSIMPTIDYYVSLGANFAVLRLAPGAGIDRMEPVRVTTPGLSLTFPLRMVQAGVQTSVDLELFVFAESRMEIANFGNAEVDRAQVAFDWTTMTFGYEEEFENALFAGDGVGTNWVTEFAGPSTPLSLGSLGATGPDGTVHSPAEDLAIVTAAIASPYLTRLRTRLPPSELDEDLLLRESTGIDIGARFDITRELHRAAEPVCDTYCSMGVGVDGSGSSRGTGSSLRCAASPGGGDRWLGLSALGLAAALLFVRRARG
jgi:hypothetical protein